MEKTVHAEQIAVTSTSSGDTPKMSLIIPVHNGERQIAACLSALCQSPPLPPHEILVVDDGSSDATAAIAARYPCRLLRQPHRGVAAARNAGIRAAHAPLLLFLDADVRLHPGMLAKVLSWFAATPTPAVMQGVYDPETSGGNAFFRFLHRRHWCCVHAGGDARRPVANLETGCLALPRKIIEECGFFDERFRLPGGEEHELGLRIAMRYPIIYEPEFTATHDCQGMLTTLADMVRRARVYAGLMAQHRRITSFAAQRISLPYWDLASMWLLCLLPLTCLAALAVDHANGRALLLLIWGACFVIAQLPLAIAMLRRWGVAAAAVAILFNPLVLLPRFAGLIAALVLDMPKLTRQRPVTRI